MRSIVAMFVVACAFAAPQIAHAEDIKPWATGVSKDNQKKALDLFRAGNTFFEEAKYTEAIPKYEQALKFWDHPSVRFNLAISFINIRQPLVAWDHLQQAIRFGDAPLGKRLFAEAMTAMATLESTLAQLDVSTEQDDVKVEVDGRELFTGKNEKKLRLLAGKHQLVATRAGYVTVSRAVDLPAGQTTKEAIALEVVKVKVQVKKVEIKTNYERRWSWWVPWSAVGGGIALALVGTGVYLDARTDMKDYDRRLAEKCPIGCTSEEIGSSLRDQERKAKRQSSIGIGLWAAGGTVALAAGVMAIMNRPRRVENQPMIAPMIAPGVAGATLTLSF